MGDVIVLDLETQKSFDEVGGRDQTVKLGVSVCVVYSYNEDSFKCYRESELDKMIPVLKNAGLVVGFNSKSFDFTVLQSYYSFNLKTIPHLDILEEVTKTLGHRLKLESIAQATILSGKSGSGLDALRYYKNNDWVSLEKYCTMDVQVTRDVYQYGRNHGQLWFDDQGLRKAIKIPWGEPPLVREVIDQALSQGSGLDIEYLNDDGKKLNYSILPKGWADNKLQAYVESESMMKNLAWPRIFSAKISPTKSSQQTRLL